MPSCPACGGLEHRASYLGRMQYRSFSYEYRACATCGSLFAHPTPDAATLSSLYATPYLEQHYGRDLQDEASIPELGVELDRVACRLAKTHPSATLLDVGCGAGRFLRAVAGLGLRAEGYEPVIATAQLAARATGLRVHTDGLERLAEPYDIIHFADVLEHVPRPLDLLATASRLATASGIVVARGPLENQPNLFQQAVRLSRLTRGRNRRPNPSEAPPLHLTLFTLMGWRALLARAALRTIEEEVYEINWPVPEKIALTPTSIIKKLSLLMSASPVGRSLGFGNRVISVAQRGRT